MWGLVGSYVSIDGNSKHSIGIGQLEWSYSILSDLSTT